jgi:hypothetical protein
MKLVEVLSKLLLLLVWPSPKNLRILLGMLIGGISGDGAPAQRTRTPAEWAEIRKVRDAQHRKKQPSGKRPPGAS